MANNSTVFAASLSEDVHHFPVADIESIRDLFRGYSLHFPISPGGIIW